MVQSSSLDFKLVQRVCLLQRALDQAMKSIEEMRGEVQDKQLIETQLAHTEQYANVQQQAIARLKYNLAQFTDTQHRLLENMAQRLNALVDHQQGEFGRLRLQVQKSDAEVQAYLRYLEAHCGAEGSPRAASEEDYLALRAEVMVARSMAVSLSRYLQLTQQHLGNLTSALDSHHVGLDYIIKTVHAMVQELNDLETSREDDPMQPPEQCLPPLPVDQALPQHSRPQQAQYIHELEAMLVEQFEQQTRLSQRCQALAAQRDYYKQQLQDASLAAPVPPPSEEASAPEIAAPPRQLLPYRRRSQSSPIQPLRFQDD